MLWLILFIILLFLGLIALFVYMVILRPQNQPAQPIAPKQFQRDRIKLGEKVVVIFGDSIIQGTISFNFVTLLQERLGPQGYHFINAGINGDLAYDLLQRIDEVVACQPDFIFILVGANDAHASSTPQKAQEYIKRNNLPQTPTLAWFRKNLTAVIARLQTASEAHIALLSIGPYGENLSSPENKKWQPFSTAIKTIATEKEVAYLPLHETMREFLGNKGPKIDYAPNDGQIDRMIGRALVLQRPLLRKSYNQISQENGFDLLSDGLHFNATAGKMVADLITTWLCDQYKFRRYSDKDRNTERHGE